MAGLTVTGNDLNTTSGDICRGVTYQLRRAANFKRFLDRFTSAQIATQFGVSTADADLIKSAFADLATVNTTFQSNRVFVDQLAGLGDV